MRGTVLAVASATARGVVSGADGSRYSYALTDLRTAAPQLGQEVDFEVCGAAAAEIYGLAHAVPTVAAPTGLPKRDWVAFYLNPNGRIGRYDYWMFGFLVLTGANILIGWIPIIGQLFTLLTSWASIAVGIKRCHDVDRSGWWIWAPFAPLFGAVAAGLTATLSRNPLPAGVLAGLFLLAGLGVVVWLVVAILARRGDPGPNRFGDAPSVTGN